MKEKNGIKNIWILLIVVIALIMLSPTAVFADGISDAMQKVINVYPNSCSYFTSDEKIDSNSGDPRCSLVNIPSRGGLPSGRTVRDARGGDAHSCHAFAEYVWYVMFGHCITENERISASELRVGDFIIFSGPHSAIYLGEDSKNYYVYDSNWAKPADNKVRYNHTISKSRGIKKCYHATNYDTIANVDPEPAGNNPFGHIDSIESTYEGVNIAGWAVDMDAPGAPVEIHIYVGGAAGSSEAKNVFKLLADLPRDDIAKAYPEAGANHGFSGVLDIDGPEVLYVYLYNIGSGENVLLGTPNVDGKKHDPYGSVDAVEETPEGVRLSGWVFDPDAPGESVEIHVYLGGPAGSPQAHNVYKLIADQERADVGKIYPNVGNYHGYNGILPIMETEDIYIYFFNIGKGQNVFVGAPRVTGRRHNPVGEIESVIPTCDGVKITGWGMDGDSLSESIDVHVYIAKKDEEPYRVYQIAADIMREDLAKRFSIAGGKHGFEVTFGLDGVEDIYVYLINKGEGAHTLFKLSAISASGHSISQQLKNKKEATCISEGYSGDQYCTKCGTILKKGQEIAATGHQHTEIRNEKQATTDEEGYTGDVYCIDCNQLISKGISIPKLIPKLSLLEKNGILTASVFNTDHVTEYGFVYGNQKDITLETPGRTRVAYSNLNSNGSYSFDTTELTDCTIRAYVVYADTNGNKQVVYSESYAR